MLFTGRNAAGPIFALKNYGWRDKQELGLDEETRTALTARWEGEKQ